MDSSSQIWSAHSTMQYLTPSYRPRSPGGRCEGMNATFAGESCACANSVASWSIVFSASSTRREHKRAASNAVSCDVIASRRLSRKRLQVATKTACGTGRWSRNSKKRRWLAALQNNTIETSEPRCCIALGVHPVTMEPSFRPMPRQRR